ncbi:phospholipase domain-containing protein [Caballeronia sp. 15715]|uniref:phospholipase domain-containing protein n=1 Tax=Caballeronia sp. 15715 TaxID=3391030 RepID=UPI0039E37C57
MTAAQAGTYTADNLPYGLGPRVPMTVVSPWSNGAFVCSQVFDHTSVLQFIEKRFGVIEANLTPWRRAICGDLTSAFDFSKPDATVPPLPSTTGYIAAADMQCALPTGQTAPAATAPQAIAAQEPGTRPARPLPYELHVNGTLQVKSQTYTLSFANTGKVGANFYVYTADPTAMPKRYTVEAGKQLSDTWPADKNGQYSLSVVGPNGYFRRFTGAVAADAAVQAETVTCYDVANGNVYLTLGNQGTAPVVFTVTDLAYGQPPRSITVPAIKTAEDHWDLSCSSNRYDLHVTMPSNPAFQRRLAGHVETGRAGTSDSAATAPVTKAV